MTDQRPIPDDLITVMEAAKRVDVNPISIRRFIDDGTLLAYQLGPSPKSRVRVSTAAVDALVRVVQPKAKPSPLSAQVAPAVEDPAVPIPEVPIYLQRVRRKRTWEVDIPSVPLTTPAQPTPEKAVEKMVEVLREYSQVWVKRLGLDTLPGYNAPLIDAIRVASDDQVRVWLRRIIDRGFDS